MYRVELKAFSTTHMPAASGKVPNVPCGVESFSLFAMMRFEGGVPNVPCGVERLASRGVPAHAFQRFLMYRVELKAETY